MGENKGQIFCYRNQDLFVKCVGSSNAQMSSLLLELNFSVCKQSFFFMRDSNVIPVYAAHMLFNVFSLSDGSFYYGFFVRRNSQRVALYVKKCY